MWYVYGLLLSNNDVYKGCTNELEERLKQHAAGKVECTMKYLPFKFLFAIAIQDRIKAFKLEKYLKTGSGRAFIKKHFL